MMMTYKLFSKVKSFLAGFQFQLDLNALSNWCTENRIGLNIEMCKVMSVFTIRSPIFFRYSIDKILLTRVTENQDLGAWLDE